MKAFYLPSVILLCLLLYNCERNPLFNDLLITDDDPNKYGHLHYNPDEYWISKVIEYKPAWGNFVNNSAYNDVDKLYGPPRGGGTVAANNSSVVSLGSGGGYMIVRFKPPVLNHKDNIKGYDFIVFGNALWTSGSPDLHFQEPGIVEVMKDENKNTLPDDTWYLLHGSDSIPGDIISMTYHRTNSLLKPVDKDQYPGTDYFPAYPDEITLDFFHFPPEKAGEVDPEIWGYADVTPVLKCGDQSGADGSGDNSLSDGEDDPDMDPVYFYTVPDTHGDKKIDSGSGGGDAFKLEWAVDRISGTPVVLDQIDFIRITSCATNLSVSEVSTEIDAVVRVRRKD